MDAALVLSGLVLGSIYAVSALGIALTYSCSRVFNFAHGAIGYFLAWCFYSLNTRHELPVWLAVLVTLGVVAPVIAVILWAAIFRHIGAASDMVKVAVTVGLFVLIPPLVLIIFGTEIVYSPAGVTGTEGVYKLYEFFGLTLNQNQLVAVVASAVVAICATLAIRFTKTGLAMRAVVDNQTLAALQGTNPGLVSCIAWIGGTVLAGLAGILLIPFLGLDFYAFTAFTIASFAAVVLGRLHSLSGAFIGAIVVGVAQQLLVGNMPSTGWLARAAGSVPFAIMLVALLLLTLRPSPPPVAATSLGSTNSPKNSLDPRTRVLLAVTLVLLLLAPLLLSSLWVGLFAIAAAIGTILLSYTLVAGEGRMISLAQITFAGVGAVVAAALNTHAGWSSSVAILTGALVCLPIGMLVAIPALRWPGLYLALGTLAFGFLIDNFVFRLDSIYSNGSGIALARPSIVGFEPDSEHAYYLFCIAVFVLVAIVIYTIRKSSIGLVLAGMRGSERALSSLGYNVVNAKLGLFASSAFVAGLGGGLYAAYVGHADPSLFNTGVGLIWFAIIVTIGARYIAAALIAGVAITVIPQLVGTHLSSGWGPVPTLLFGLGAVGLAVEPRGFIAQVSTLTQALQTARASRDRPSPMPEGRPEATDDPVVEGERQNDEVS